jgi:hypothetical protein
MFKKAVSEWEKALALDLENEILKQKIKETTEQIKKPRSKPR